MRNDIYCSCLSKSVINRLFVEVLSAVMEYRQNLRGEAGARKLGREVLLILLPVSPNALLGALGKLSTRQNALRATRNFDGTFRF